jgi:lipopolysaccharide biosynthesis glycosyltransferase
MSGNLVTLHLAFGANERYFPGLYCAVGSALSALGADYRAIIHVIDAGISPESRKNLENLVDTGNYHLIEWIPAPRERFRSIRITGYHPSILYRLALPELLQGVKRVIYLDADTLVFKCLGKLWEECLSRGEPLLAVQDWETKNIAGDSMKLAEILGVNDKIGYFNSGVLLLRLDEFRKENFSNRTYALLEAHGGLMRFPDQTALNCHFVERWGTLDKEWNYPAWAFDQQCGNNLPSICHYTNHAPWLSRRYSPSHALFDRIARELGLVLPQPEKQIFISCWKSFANWCIAPLRCAYQTARPILFRVFDQEEALLSRNALAAYWLNFFVTGPNLVIRYRRRIRQIYSEGLEAGCESPLLSRLAADTSK